MSVPDDVREALAAEEHERWARWQRYLHSCGEIRSDGALVIHADRIAHWERQINTPYAQLSEREKDSDREQVDAALSALEAAGFEVNRKGTLEALEPFAKWAVHKLENDLPAKIAADASTPVLGDIWSREPEVTVGDLRAAAMLTASRHKEKPDG